MSLDLDKLVSSERNYQQNIRSVLDEIKGSSDIEGMLKKIVLFCKYALSVNGNQCKKYLCLQLIRDIFECVPSSNFDKMLDTNIAQKVLKIVTMENSNSVKDSRQKEEQNEDYFDKMMGFAIQTIVFWAKKIGNGKSAFKQAYEDIKKSKVPLPKVFKYYNPQMLLELWGDKNVPNQKSQSKIPKPVTSNLTPIVAQLSEKFNNAKAIIEAKISESLVYDDELNLRQIQKQIKEFLLQFFMKLKDIEEDSSLDRSTIVLYYHIMNNLHNKISNKQYIPTNDMIHITRETFQANYDNNLASVNRMDIVKLVSTQKLNTLTIFERIHRRIEEQEKELPHCEISLELEDSDKKGYLMQSKSRFTQ